MKKEKRRPVKLWRWLYQWDHKANIKESKKLEQKTGSCLWDEKDMKVKTVSITVDTVETVLNIMELKLDKLDIKEILDYSVTGIFKDTEVAAENLKRLVNLQW